MSDDHKVTTSPSGVNATFVTYVSSPSAITVPKEIRYELEPYIGKSGTMIVSPLQNASENPENKSFEVKLGHYASQLYPQERCGSSMYAHLVKLYGSKVRITLEIQA